MHSKRPRWISALAALALLVGLAGCTSFPVSTDWATGYDFSALKTWGWGPFDESIVGSDPRLNNELLHERIQRSIRDDLTARGYGYDTSSPDFWVEYHLAIDRKLDVNHLRTRVGYGWGYGGVVVSEPVIREYEEGTLLVDFIDPTDKRLIWRGSVRARVLDRQTPAERDARMSKIVNAVLAKFPPKTN